MALSGQKTIAAAGTAEALGAEQINAPLLVKALDTNTGKVYIGNDGAGDVDSSNGLVLLAEDVVLFDWVGSTASIMLNVSVNGEGVSWLRLDA